MPKLIFNFIFGLIKRAPFLIRIFFYVDFLAQIKLINFKGVLVYRKTIVNLGHNASIKVEAGVLSLGKGWLNGQLSCNMLVIKDNSSLRVHDSFIIYSDFKIVLNKNASLVLGEGYINNGANIECFQSINIGRGVNIGSNVVIRDGDSKKIFDSKGFLINPDKSIIICDNVWIGDGAKILKGVTIGEGAIIAAGAVVVSDVPSRSLFAGIPARLIKEDIRWEG